MAGNNDPVQMWISKGKDRYALLALMIQSKLALVLAIMLTLVFAAWLLGPTFAALGSAVAAAFKGVRWLKGL